VYSSNIFVANSRSQIIASPKQNSDVEMKKITPARSGHQTDTTYNALPSKTSTKSSSRNGSQISKKSEIPYSEITFEYELGRGSYGVVYKGSWRNQQVAVKKVIGELSDAQLEAFSAEADLLSNLRPHRNVVLFLGVCIEPLCIVIEFYKNGSLLDYLHSSKPLTPKLTLNILQGIAAGMVHLHKEGIIHRDLAARNILLNAEMGAVVSDFGFARTLQSEEDTAKTASDVGPLRWMSPESLKGKVYSYKTDVWSFGITAWEVLTRGKTPYEDEAQAFVAASAVMRGVKRLAIPSSCPSKFGEALKRCWEQNPDKRPDFQELFDVLTLEKV